MLCSLFMSVVRLRGGLCSSLSQVWLNEPRHIDKVKGGSARKVATLIMNAAFNLDTPAKDKIVFV